MIEILFATIPAVIGAFGIAISFYVTKRTKISYIPNRWQYLPSFAISIQVLVSILANLYISGIWFVISLLGSLAFTLVVTKVCHKKRMELIDEHYPKIGDENEN